MIVPFKIALINCILMLVSWLAAGAIIKIWGSPFPNIHTPGDVIGGFLVLFSIWCGMVTVVAAIVGLVRL